MRVVITRRTRLDYRDGINIFIAALANELSGAGHDVTVIATTVGPPERVDRLLQLAPDVRLVSLERQKPRFALEGLSLRWLLRGPATIDRYSPELVINNGSVPFRTHAITCTVAHDLGWATNRHRFVALRRAYKRYSYSRCDHIVATATEIRRGLAVDLGVPEGRISYIPRCIELAAITAARLTERDDAIAHTGTAPYKNPTATVRAFALMKRDTTRLFVEGRVTAALSDAVMSLPVTVRRRVELLGELGARQLWELLGRARVAAYPTLYSVPTASATIIEAVGAATPMVGSSMISADLLRDGHNGLVRDTPADMASAFDQLLGDDPLWQAQSRVAATLAPNFAPDLVAAAYVSFAAAGAASG